MTWSRSIKRTLLIALLLLTGGAIVNVAVASGCALWSKHPFDPTQALSHSGELSWIVSAAEGFGITWVSMVPENDIWVKADGDYVVIPSWSRAADPPSQSEFDDPTGPWTIEFGYGWPARSTVASVQRRIYDSPDVRASSDRFHVLSGISVLDDGSTNPMPFRILPVRPIWPGFAINTIFYAAILWLLWIAPGKVRRFVIVRGRVRRGRCPACGYLIAPGPRMSDRCSECGQPLALNSC